MDKIEIEGRTIRVYKNADGGPLILWMMQEHREGEGENTFRKLCERAGEKPFTLALIPCEDWNRDFSPWPAEGFAGEGEKMQIFLTQKCLPVLEKRYPSVRRYAAGYSLAGLFALWIFYETGCFDGAASCSGSLWFPGWQAYIRSHLSPKKDAVIYLSLGGKEEKTRDPLMAAVGPNTRETIEFLKKDPGVLSSTLRMQHGGHFSDPEGRCAEGMQWLLERAEEAL